jgi:hypothetical protein
MSRFLIICSALLILTSATADRSKAKPAIYLIGDSTVKNGQGRGDGGLWDEVFTKLKPCDYVIMHFGHNGPINDNFRARGTINGNGEETEEPDNITT